MRIEDLVLGVVAAVALSPSVASAQPVSPPPGGSAQPVAGQPAAPPATSPAAPAQPTAAPQTTPQTTPTSPAPATAPASPVDDAAWEALQGRQVVVKTGSGSARGELLRSDGQTLVLVRDSGEVVTIPKAEATGVRLVQANQPAPAGTAAGSDPAATESMAELSPGAQDSAEPQPLAGEETAEEELTDAQKRRKERRDKREHALLGAFTMQGATYTHWRGDGVQAGHASYAMDFGVGVNASKGFGMYAMAGGLLGAKIRNNPDNERVKANYGHIAFVFAFSRKYFFSTVGAGFAFSRLRFPEDTVQDDTLQKDRGLAIPTRLVGKIPLPHKLYLGLGLTYELALVRGFSRAVNGIGGQIVVGRW